MLVWLFRLNPTFSHLEESIADDKNSSYLNMGVPDDVTISLELKDWQFSVESAEVMSERCRFNDLEDSFREEKSWHTSFESFKVKANGIKNEGSSVKAYKYPVEAITVCICIRKSSFHHFLGDEHFIFSRAFLGGH